MTSIHVQLVPVQACHISAEGKTSTAATPKNGGEETWL